jgi:hypothetical protein
MRTPFLLSLVVTIVAGTVYWYQSSAALCPVPLSYHLGVLDPSFELSQEEAKQYIQTAVSVWEEAVGRELFVYDESAVFTVNFVFDERQAIANSEENQRTTLDAQRAENERIQAAVESLQREYETLNSSYRNRLVAYETRLDVYNAEVRKYNDRGGAPPEIFSELETERRALEREATAVSAITTQLNGLATEINRLAERGNRLVEQYNREVDRYNAAFGFEREFTQGDFQGDRINIYKFSTETELITVLAHEFGHALGIGHVEGTSSLMYYLLGDTSQSPALSNEDLQAFEEVCGFTETFGQKIRRLIRAALATI